MSNFTIRFIITFLILMPLQALVFNHMVLFNVAVPFVYLYLIVMLPMTLNTNASTAIGFFTGFCMDLFMDTPGLNALSCTTLAFARKPIFHLYVTLDEDLAGRSPSSLSMGPGAFMKYILTMSLGFCLLLFTVEAFQFFNLRLMLLRILTSTIYTFFLIYTLDSIINRRREKKL